MSHHRALKGGGLVVVAAVLSLACGGGGGTTGGGGEANKGEIIIGSDLPTSGADASGGLPTQYGAAFAVKQKATVKGFKLTFLGLDDAVNGVHDGQKGVQNVQQMISNTKVLGMVGPLNSNVAKAEIPVANQVPLAMLSPANTNECLTQSFDYCQKENGFTPQSLRPSGKNNYFRIAAADTFQGPAMADFAIDTLKATKMAVWDDEETFGKGVADNFAKEVTKKSGTVVSRKSYDPKSKADFKDFLLDAKDKGAQAIYVGATSATKGCIARAQMKGIFTTDIYYLGPDGLGDKQCISDAGDMANDHLYVSQGVADATQNPDAKTVVEAYKKEYPNPQDLAAYTFAAYDCAAILIDAIGRAIDSNGGNMPSRQQVVDAVAKTKDFKALSGTVTFDKNGDPTQPVLQIQQAKNGDYAFVKQLAAPSAS
jgi:branched-chain amino acid transport system substrate-binding protein